MKEVWVASDSLVSPLGFTSEENYQHLINGVSGVSLLDDPALSKDKIYAGRIREELPTEQSAVSRFESLCFLSIKNAIQGINIDLSSNRVVFILSTTKGNIELLEIGLSENGINLFDSAKKIAARYGNTQTPLVVSNACISGVMAALVAKRLLQSGQYDHAIVTGADALSRFVISGFQSLQAISPEPCKPFDANRKGVNLGEAAATLVLSVDPQSIGGQRNIKITGGGLSNDANHISGPSRTGEELATAISHALREANVTASDVDFISAHGTATLYNDEMEAKAFTIAGLSSVPLNSLKGYFGHTLGAAGIVEMIISMRAMLNNELIPTFGFGDLGVSKSLNVIKENGKKELNTCLKTASGFGGCNAAIIFNKNIYQ